MMEFHDTIPVKIIERILVLNIRFIYLFDKRGLDSIR